MAEATSEHETKGKGLESNNKLPDWADETDDTSSTAVLSSVHHSLEQLAVNTADQSNSSVTAGDAVSTNHANKPFVGTGREQQTSTDAGKVHSTSEALEKQELEIGGNGSKGGSNVRQDEAADCSSKNGATDAAGDDQADVPDTSVGGALQEYEGTEVQKSLAEGAPGYVTAGRWSDLQLPEQLLNGLTSVMRFEKPSKVQSETLPLILTPPYKHLIAQAHSGSGKTTCFAIGMLARVDESLSLPQSICACNTRELCNQNFTVISRIASKTNIKLANASADENHRVLGQSQVIVGTPGKLLNAFKRKRIVPLHEVRVFVLDEADEMLKAEGFRSDSVQLMKLVHDQAGSNNVQLLLFSATFSEGIETYARSKVPGANKILLPREHLSLDVIKPYWVDCTDGGQRSKDDFLLNVFPLCDKIGQAIIFVRSRRDAERLASDLLKQGWSKVRALHGGRSHEERDEIVRGFRAHESRILVTTDMLARGFDQESVTLVVNYDLPVDQNDGSVPNFEQYLHRIGRSGRFGRRGIAFNLCGRSLDKEMITHIQEHFEQTIPQLSRDLANIEQVLEHVGLKDENL